MEDIREAMVMGMDVPFEEMLKACGISEDEWAEGEA